VHCLWTEKVRRGPVLEGERCFPLRLGSATLRGTETGRGRNPLSQLRRGVLEHCVLSLLSSEALYGFDLVRRLSEADRLVTSEGPSCPPLSLSRLRREGWVSRWMDSGPDPSRRYYAGDGRQALSSFSPDWRRFHAAVDPLLFARGPRTLAEGVLTACLQ
jgi:PadR family transcriptional regulator PadR